MSRGKVAVVVADAHKLLADALADSLGRHEGLEVSGSRPTSLEELVETFHHETPDVVLIDLWIPGLEPAAAIKMIAAKVPDAKIVVLSWLYGPGQIQHALDSGAAGFLTKSVTVAKVAEAIRRAHQGESPVFSEELDLLMRTTSERELKSERAWERLAALTGREIQILGLLDEGFSVKEIANQLTISPSTVRSHVHHAMEKAGAKTQAQALTMARRHGLIKGYP